MEAAQPNRWEILSAIVGAVAGAMSAGFTAWLTGANLWPATICGIVIGAFGGGLGQGLIEGIVVVILCAVVPLPLFYKTGLPSWLRGIVIGFSAGAGAGWMVHGCFDQLNRGR